MNIYEPPNSDQPLVLLLSDDLMWMSRILGTAQALGIRLLAARDLPRLIEHMEKTKPACVIVELGSIPVGDAAAAVTARHPQARLVAYGSHVDLPELEAARAAGCAPVLTRSQMAEELKTRLPIWAGAQTDGD